MPDAPPTSDTSKPDVIEKNWLPFVIGAVAIVAIIGALLLLQPKGTGVPDVTGMTTEDAEKAIADAGFAVGSVEGSAVADVDEGVVLAQDPEAGVKAEEGAEINITVSVSGVLEMPDVTGMTEDEARSTLEAEGLEVETASYYVDDVDKGLVAAQLPDAGETVAAGSRVGVLVSLGETPEDVTRVKVPDVTGEQEKSAVTALTSVGLTVRVYYASSADVPQGAVIDQEPVGGTEVPISTAVQILVSQGSTPKPPEPTTVEVPPVVGKAEADARKMLSDAGLQAVSAPVYSDDVPAGSVVEQYPTPRTEVLVGSAVGIAVSQGPETPEATEVPDVVGLSSGDATKALKASGLVAHVLESATPDGQPADIVFAQVPEAGVKVEEGSQVLILVANGETAEMDTRSVE